MDTVLGFVCGLVLGFVICSWIYYGDDDKLLRDCQKPLPRDQYCKIIAVPEQVK